MNIGFCEICDLQVHVDELGICGPCRDQLKNEQSVYGDKVEWRGCEGKPQSLTERVPSEVEQ